MSSEPEAPELTSLPREVLLKILVTHTDIKARFRVAAVCRTLRALLADYRAWADVDEVSLVTNSAVCYINGHRFTAMIKSQAAALSLLVRTRPRTLRIFEPLRGYIRRPHRRRNWRIIPGHSLCSLPLTIEDVRLNLPLFDNAGRRLIQQFSSSLRRLEITTLEIHVLTLGVASDFKLLEVLLLSCIMLTRATLLFVRELPNLRELRISGLIFGLDVDDLPEALSARLSPVCELCVCVCFVPYLRRLSARAYNALEVLCLTRERICPRDTDYSRLLPLPPRLGRLSVLDGECFTAEAATALRRGFFAQHATEELNCVEARRLTIERRAHSAGEDPMGDRYNAEETRAHLRSISSAPVGDGVCIEGRFSVDKH